MSSLLEDLARLNAPPLVEHRIEVRNRYDPDDTRVGSHCGREKVIKFGYRGRHVADGTLRYSSRMCIECERDRDAERKRKQSLSRGMQL